MKTSKRAHSAPHRYTPSIMQRLPCNPLRCFARPPPRAFDLQPISSKGGRAKPLYKLFLWPWSNLSSSSARSNGFVLTLCFCLHSCPVLFEVINFEIFWQKKSLPVFQFIQESEKNKYKSGKLSCMLHIHSLFPLNWTPTFFLAVPRSFFWTHPYPPPPKKKIPIETQSLVAVLSSNQYWSGTWCSVCTNLNVCIGKLILLACYSLRPRLHEDDVKTKRKVCGKYPIWSFSDKATGACLHEDDARTFKDAFVWSDDEVELILSRVDDNQTSTCVDWDTVIRQVFSKCIEECASVCY